MDIWPPLLQGMKKRNQGKLHQSISNDIAEGRRQSKTIPTCTVIV